MLIYLFTCDAVSCDTDVRSSTMMLPRAWKRVTRLHQDKHLCPRHARIYEDTNALQPKMKAQA